MSARQRSAFHRIQWPFFGVLCVLIVIYSCGSPQSTHRVCYLRLARSRLKEYLIRRKLHRPYFTGWLPSSRPIRTAETKERAASRDNDAVGLSEYRPRRVEQCVRLALWSDGRAP